ncbi:SpoIVB peptidase [Bacillota bacterium LX-D]|nr:SpoIVB peptidase [Bacillota bacterium LX-D]
MKQNKYQKTLGILFSVLILTLCLTPQARSFFNMPQEQTVIVGEEIKFNLNFPQQFLQKLSFYVSPSSGNLLQIKENDFKQNTFNLADGWPVASNPGKLNLEMKLFGFIPIKTVTVNIFPEVKVIPGGHSIGVLMHSKGIMVIGFSPISDKNNKKQYPAKKAGLEIGDIILAINGQTVKTDGEAAQLIDKLGEKGNAINVLIKRNDKQLLLKVKPIYCSETKRNRVGLYIRDSAAGVGTLTFIEPNSHCYGALGHIIADTDTNKQIALGEGKIINASIQGINQGEKGRPGEKIGTFLDNTTLTGDIKKNTPYGIFGKLDKVVENNLYPEPIPIALGSHIKTGKAEILTVVNNEKIERFNIKIEKVMPQHSPDGKGLIIRITDPRLLKITGGIVQGMSGSPIIQNGSLVGAVTHVFINDPTRGYGILAEWMLLETGLLNNNIHNIGKGALSSFFCRTILLSSIIISNVRSFWFLSSKGGLTVFYVEYLFY